MTDRTERRTNTAIAGDFFELMREQGVNVARYETIAAAMAAAGALIQTRARSAKGAMKLLEALEVEWALANPLDTADRNQTATNGMDADAS